MVQLLVNVVGTFNVLQAAKDANVKRFIYSASSSCYGIPDKYPRLNAQHSEYTLAQLKAFRLELRKNDPSAVMRTIAQKLTEQEMKAVADYIQGLR